MHLASSNFSPYDKPPQSDTDFADEREKGRATKKNLRLFSFATRDLDIVFQVKPGPP